MSKKELKAVEAILKPFEIRTVKFKDGKFDGLKPRETKFLKSVCEIYREENRDVDTFSLSPQKEKDWGLGGSAWRMSGKDKLLFSSNEQWVHFTKEGIEEINKHKWYLGNKEIYEDMENIFEIVFEHDAEATGHSLKFKAFINIGTESDSYGYQTLFKVELSEEILKYF